MTADVAAQFQGTSTSVAPKNCIFLAFRLGMNFCSMGVCPSVILIMQTLQTYTSSFTRSAGIHSAAGRVIAQVIKQLAWGRF